MNVIAVIPARYQSTRMPGKPLADICGKPMIWWVYNQVKKVKELNEIYIATDDQRIVDVCETLRMNYVLTANNHPNHITRVYEVSEKIDADYYICVNGDEPLVDPESIKKIIPDYVKQDSYFGGAMRVLTDPAQTIDFANIKIVTNNQNRAIYMSRTPIPYPKGTLNIQYNKYVGIECFNKKSLNFFIQHTMGKLEEAEDIDHLRFIENGMPMFFSYVDTESISVDTQKDLDYIRKVINEKIQNGYIEL